MLLHRLDGPLGKSRMRWRDLINRGTTTTAQIAKRQDIALCRLYISKVRPGHFTHTKSSLGYRRVQLVQCVNTLHLHFLVSANPAPGNNVTRLIEL